MRTPCGSPQRTRTAYAFSTCENSSSTGVERPKISTATRNTKKVGKITRKQAEEIAKTKWPDLNAADMEAAVRLIAGSARSMGVEVEGV